MFCLLFLSDIYDSQNSRTENDVCDELENEVETNEEDDQIRTNAHTFCRGHALNCFNEECKTA